ncbi:isocitrate lyase/PEP mutase family protein [Methylobacterium nodulans]|uniref:Carboxyvinyl-carboxyphosphonate phosphorylmutase n=1 Tax=Methylobacterium nodulans (strain LMG 21967 / CNCM I-2342 / ORS 2060) TaxID=460265 RepID=B8INC5_METNO|nr:isocitrate lyase/PEP mutase family protein [Methylobacterium nodulans]ACL56451.1 carboxyvinyl-carboxyphosphonate phosphorylmutase [Methylobacterium nodulans ORS 2060]
MRATTRLAQRLRQPGILVAPGCHDALGARIIEQAGFEAVYMTGNGLSASLIGAPDVGLLTMTEMVARGRSLAAAVSVPVVADADTGYGNLNNVVRTIREYEAAGVAAVHLEDQVTPKKCGAMKGLALVSAEEHADKIRAAVAARTDPDFLIIGRSDARIPNGFPDALRRGQIYAEAGADLVLLEMLQSIEEMREAVASISKPLVFNYVEGKVPDLKVSDFAELGFKLLNYPVSSTLAYARMMRDFAASLARDGTTLASGPPLLSLHDYEQILGLGAYH